MRYGLKIIVGVLHFVVVDVVVLAVVVPTSFLLAISTIYCVE